VHLHNGSITKLAKEAEVHGDNISAQTQGHLWHPLVLRRYGNRSLDKCDAMVIETRGGGRKA